MIKYLVFYGTVLLGIPLAVLISWFKRSFLYVVLLVLMGALMFPESTTITFDQREFYRMATRGFEIHLADLCALIILLSMFLFSKDYRIHWIPPMSLPYLLFLMVAVASWFMTEGEKPIPYEVAFDKLSGDLITYKNFELSLYPWFEILKIVRGFFMYWVMANFMQDPKARQTFLWGMVAMTFYMTGYAVFDRYVVGVNRASANIGHVNDFNTFVGMTGSFAIGAAFRTRSWLKAFVCWAAVGGGFLSIVLTISRSSLAGYALAVFIGMAISYLRFPSFKNTAYVGLSFVLAMLIMLRAADTLVERFFHMESYEGSMMERRLFMAEAKLMAKEHVLGVGLGNFSAWSWLRYSEETEAPPGALAHNIYYLTLGELGVFGLMAFILIWLRYYGIVIASVFSRVAWRNSELFSFAMGALVSTVVLQLQNLFHFSYRHTSVYLVIHMVMGMTAAVYYECKAKRRVDSRFLTQNEYRPKLEPSGGY